MDALANVAGVQLGVDVESQEGGGIFASRGDARDAVVFLGVEGGEGEGVLVELGVTHGCDGGKVDGGGE